MRVRGCNLRQHNGTALLCKLLGVVALLSGHALAVSGLHYVAITPCRVADTRTPTPNPIAADTSRDFTVAGACGIPTTGAAAYAMNVTVVPFGSLGFLSVYPTGSTTGTSTSLLNSFDARVKANAAIVPAGTSGDVTVFASDETHVILDVTGYFTTDNSNPQTELQFFPMTPCRVMDTRQPPSGFGGPSLTANAVRFIHMQLSTSCSISTNAKAYSLNFTVIPHASLGAFSAWAGTDPRPKTSILNSYNGQTVANAAIVAAAQVTGSHGGINVSSSADADLIIDINGYFASPASGGLVLYPTTPCRLLDTRKTTGPISGNPPTVVNVATGPCGAFPTAGAYVLNTTAIPTAGTLGFLSVWPDGVTQPNVSTTNAFDGAIVSNMAIVPSTNGNVDAYASNPSELLLDISSYFAP